MMNTWKLLAARYEQGKRSREDEDYLCQDCDVVLLVEPCIMCAMALVHSRARRVAFWEADQETGLLSVGDFWPQT